MMLEQSLISILEQYENANIETLNPEMQGYIRAMMNVYGWLMSDNHELDSLGYKGEKLPKEYELYSRRIFNIHSKISEQFRAIRNKWPDNKPPRVLVCGSRTWQDYYIIGKELDNLKLPEGSTIIEGGNVTRDEKGNVYGADFIVGCYAKFKGFELEVHEAKWAKHGKAAGPIRNQEMLDTGVDLVVAFQIGESMGTQDMINRARAKSVKVIVIKGGSVR